MPLQFQGRVGTGQQLLDMDLRDLRIVTLDTGTYLYATTGVGGGLSGFALQQGALANWENSLYYSAIAPEVISGALSFLDADGQNLLVFGGAMMLQAVVLGANGSIGARVQTGSLISGTQAIGAVASVSLQSGLAVYVADEGTGALATYATQGDSLVQQSGGALPGLVGTVAMTSVTVSGNTFLLAADQGHQGVSCFRVDTVTGALSATDTMGAQQGLGVATPTAMEVVQAFGATWVILAAAGSSSLSVMQLGATGELIPADHVIDTLHTRFGGVQSLAVVKAEGQVFVVAGGADDGLSLFTLLPDGRLVHLQSLVHADGLGLMDVGQIAAQRVGDQIQVFVSSDDEAGLSQFSIPLSGLGQVLTGGAQGSAGDDLLIASGGETLRGWGGNDILVAGAGDTVMTGGAGADLFVLSSGGHSATITDFDPANDRLDLSDWPMLRDPAQLTLTPTRTGAIITFRDNTLVIQTASGQPLSGIGSHFLGPDRVLVLGQPVGQSLTGSRDGDTLTGGAGNDTINAGGGHDQVWAGDGDDLIEGGWGFDTIGAGAGNDTICGDGGNDLIHAGWGDDQIWGGDGDDQVWADTGVDLLYGEDGADTLGGGAGNDTIWGDAGTDLIFGGLDNDLLGGGSQADTIWGAEGQDLIYGGQGWDRMGGGAGNDTLWGGSENDQVYGGLGDDLLGGDGQNDEIWGGDGHDILYGGTGEDTLGGGTGNDQLWGGAGRDTLWGGLDDDTLGGGTEADQIWGGAGADLFVFAPGSGQDTIGDFTPGQDRLHLTGTSSLSDISLSTGNGGVWIGYGGDLILLSGLTLADLGSADFVLG